MVKFLFCCVLTFKFVVLFISNECIDQPEAKLKDATMIRISKQATDKVMNCIETFEKWYILSIECIVFIVFILFIVFIVHIDCSMEAV